MTGDERKLERYLNTATRGLWGRRKREAREELECHLLERTRRLQVGGLSRAEAVDRACGRMGSAGKVALGFMEVHSMSKLLLITTFVLIGGSAVLWAMQSIAQQAAPDAPWGSTSVCTTVEYTSPLPSYKSRFCPSDIPGITFEALTAQFKAAGLSIKPVDYERYPGRIYEHLEVTFPNGQKSRIPFAFPGRREKPGLYAGSYELIQELQMTSGSPFQLEGWSQPSLLIAGKKIVLESPRAEVMAYNLYAARAFELNSPRVQGTSRQFARVRLARPNYPKVLEGLVKRTFQVDKSDGTVLAAFAHTGELDVILDVAPVKGNKLEVYLPSGALNVRSQADFKESSEPAVYVVSVQTRYDSLQAGHDEPSALEVKLLE